ncbi:DUF4157 domain-containing protein [Streptomyces sp. NPDC059142]|uniref:eCIS core domain-containing protein n=1 Tax=Streptomyces sp. NPDC059142 TaxID=3346739 RepID=UPI0036A5AEFC
MSTQSTSATAQEARAAQEARRRKRKERAAASRTPEPKDIVSGAGQPLDVSVRRELEEQLGHDLGRVRLHTDRDAGHLTSLLGADAVAVGQDIFFGEGAYRPGTADGQRLLAHELLHTIQNPDGLGTLRAGRDLGAVSLPQEGMEREAEGTAQALVRNQEQGPETAPEIAPAPATPGWLRYATVDADRRRMEELDPATLIDRLTNGVVRSLRGDPEDRSGRARLQLARMAPTVQESVLDRLEVRLPTPVLDRLLDLVDETERQGPLPLEASTTPEAVPDGAEAIRQERAQDATVARGERKKAEKEKDDRREQRQDAGSAREGAGQAPSASSGGAPVAQTASVASGQAAGQDRETATARQNERADAQQQDKDAAGQTAEEDKENAGGGQEEDGQDAQQESQAADESEDQAAEEGAADPQALDKSAQEPGEKDRTGGDLDENRRAGDPENEEDADDEPLGLEEESEELDEEKREDEEEAEDEEAEEDAEEAEEGTEDPQPDGALDGSTPAAANRNGQKDSAGSPGDGAPGVIDSPATQDQSAEALRQAEDDPDGAGAGGGHSADSEDRFARDLSTDKSIEQEIGPEPDERADDKTAEGPDDTERDPSDPDDAEREKQQAEERKEDAEAKRRDEAARTADEGSGPPVPGSGGETAGPGQLAKADEDARRQAASTSSGSSASGSDGGTSAGGGSGSTGETGAKSAGSSGGAAEVETATASGTGSGPAASTGTGTGTAGGGTAPGAAVQPQKSSAPVDTPDTQVMAGMAEGPDVTEGKGPVSTPGQETGPEKVSTAGPSPIPKLASGNGPSPMSAGPEPKSNAAKTEESPKSGAAKPAPRQVAAPKRQAVRKAAKAARSGGGGAGGGRSAPAPARGGGARGGGGRGRGSAASGPAKPKKEAPAPDVSQGTPESGLATASKLKPHVALETLRGVDGAVGNSVGKERAALRKGPPRTERPSGSPKTVPGGPRAAAPGTYSNAKVSRTDAAQGKTPDIKGEQKPEGELPATDMPEPSWWDIGLALLGGLLKEILPLDDLIDSILQLPTTDEGMHGAKVGNAPGLPLQDDSDPRRTDEQGQKLDERKNELHQSGREDAARPMGEDGIYPDVPKETLTGKVPGGGKRAGRGGARKASGGGVPIESASAVAEHDRGPQIQAGFADGQQKMSTERKTKDDKARDDKQKHDKDLKREVDASSKTQDNARQKGQSEISDSRDKWRKEQDDKVTEIDGKKGKKYDKVRKDIDDKEEETDKDVDKRTEDDNKKIDDEQTGAEKEAEKKQKDGEKDADNWLEEAIEKLKEMFEELKNGIKTLFEKARKAVTDIIDEFKEQVFKLIDAARNWVIDQINEFADALIALGDELLADYPAMRDKWRNTIDGARDWAVEKVNEAADALKEVAGTLLDGLAGALTAGLDMLEGGLLAAVDLAETVTVGALEFGAAVVAGLGEWAAIFNDIVSDPGDWISKAGAAAETGARDHLFDEVKAAVKEWFNQKVQELIGVPMEDFQELISGGVTVEQMAQMAWDEALPQLPVIIGVMVVEKVVAKLIPGAGWVMAIIDALQVAWGALSEILAAFGLFMDFLKSVKSGNGALPFAKAVAAGVVALLELIYQFLVEGISRFMGGVTRKLGDMLKGIRSKKRPGPPDAPGAPSTPNKPGQAESPGPTNKPGPTEKDGPADKLGQRPAPRKPSRDETSRPKPGPRPTKRPSPEKRPRPARAGKPKKRRDDEERREEGREVNTARRRMRDARRKLRRDDDKATPGKPRRGPARDTLRPKKRRPAKDRDGTRKPDLTKKRRRPESPTRRKLRRARQTIKSALNRARRAARRLFGKGRKLGRRINNHTRRLRDQWRRQRDRLRRNRERKRDSQREQERQRQDSMRDLNLPTVKYRDETGTVHTLQFDGRGGGAELEVHSVTTEVDDFLNDWDFDIRAIKEPQKQSHQLQAWRAAKGNYRAVKALQKRLPRKVPAGTVGKTWERDYRALRGQLKDLAQNMADRVYGGKKPPLPPTVLPAFADGVLAPRQTKAHYIQPSTPNGEIASLAKKGNPKGWDQAKTAKFTTSPGWYKRMHLLPESMGGLATGSNLVPAPVAVNNHFYNKVEGKANAARKAGGSEDMIWYLVHVTFSSGRSPSWQDYIPRRITSLWGGYKVNANNKWEEKKPTSNRTVSDSVIIPTGSPTRAINVNRESAEQIAIALGATLGFGRRIKALGPFSNKVDLLSKLHSYELGKKPGTPPLPDFSAVVARILTDPNIIAKK